MLDRLTIERMRACGGPMLVALSGGGDSVALLGLLVAEHGADAVRAGVVDHALREGSDADARRALGFAEALGVRGTILTLGWPEGANRAQRAAREARYAALCEHARQIGAHVIATAHNADDQAETVFMRAGAGSSWRGLAGIAPFAAAPMWPEGLGLYVARPLLSARREELRAYLREQSADWIEDPANANPKFERVRIRARLAKLECEGFDPMRLAALAARLRDHANALDRAALALIERADLEPTISIARATWAGPHLVRQRALAVLMAAASGAAREAPFSVMAQLEPRVFAVDYQGGTHSGVSFRNAGDRLALTRDPGAALGRAGGAAPLAPLNLSVNAVTIWDGRIALTARESGWRAVPERNAALVALEKNGRRLTLQQTEGAVEWRPLAADRVRHALASAVNPLQPL
ncbi:MAG: tRNA lysidine(34) synthetase TilS [Hyphomonadaceae bacterium JAD_PAG50586_4]|nr:MAG: tRNA lysidine(34) synthetase TilS [Hyphomonadaceae bacterium JAD_PAG50586_4]